VIFRRRPQGDPSAAIQAFWAWWSAARPRAEKMIAGTPDEAFVTEIGDRVSAIDPRLQWEFTAGRETAHVLVVTSAGDAGLRALAERWRRAAPPADGTFAYASSRQGNPAALDGSVLEIAGHRLDLGELRFGAVTDTEASAVHVTVRHPDFPGLPEEARLQVAFLALDWVLGEDRVEIWIGAISAASEPGPVLDAAGLDAAGLDAAGLDAAGLVAAVDAVIPPDGAPRWSTMAGTRRGKPLVALVQTPLKAARWPAYDLHIRIDVPYRTRDENGFPSEEVFPALYALEDRIDARVDGAVVVAHETSDGLRTTHLYADRPAAAAVLEPLLADWPDGRIRMRVTPDPGWKAVSHLAR
jgi:hypothetical protein